MGIKVVDIQTELARLSPLTGRGKETSEAQAAAAFATLAPFRDGAVFVGAFQGDSGWEKHPKGDEIVQILDGATTLTILTDTGPEVLTLTAGALVVVPRDHWHRFNASDGVTVMTATPQPTEHSFADDPR
ncbi:MAG: cupin domain-containing protein [Proteobacteria bacterium]|nr:cupin domain-containing protein [Pseudomonadota bacterium]